MHKNKVLKIYLHIKKISDLLIDRELTLSAASLSFYTIFTFIPLLLIFMTIFTSSDLFSGIYLKVQNIIFENFLPTNQEMIISYINSFLQHSIQMSTLSLGMLFASSLLFFQNYEYITNKIFHAPNRTFLQSVRIYLLMITITPTSLGVAFYITGYFATLIASNTITSSINILPLIPYIIIWVLFFILFKLSANIKVGFKAALLSSFIISIVFSVAKNSFIYYIFLNQSYTTLYGSFSILLFLFLWTYFSWLIFLYGLRLCYFINRVYKNR